MEPALMIQITHLQMGRPKGHLSSSCALVDSMEVDYGCIQDGLVDLKTFPKQRCQWHLLENGKLRCSLELIC